MQRRSGSVFVATLFAVLLMSSAIPPFPAQAKAHAPQVAPSSQSFDIGDWAIFAYSQLTNSGKNAELVITTAIVEARQRRA